MTCLEYHLKYAHLTEGVQPKRKPAHNEWFDPFYKRDVKQARRVQGDFVKHWF